MVLLVPVEDTNEASGSAGMDSRPVGVMVSVGMSSGGYFIMGKQLLDGKVLSLNSGLTHDSPRQATSFLLLSFFL